MKTITLLTVVLVILLVSCVPTTAPAPEKPTLPVVTSTPVPPSLPATLTPAPTLTQTSVTPTALYAAVPLSPDDEEIHQKALNDIPVYRQGDIQLLMRDEQGQPLSGYQVKYRQISHDFLFGGVADPFYGTEFKQAGLNTITVYLDWRWIEPELSSYDLDFTNYWLGIDELKSGGMHIKTNNLFNTSSEDMPPYWRDVPYDEFLKRLSDHISTTVKRFAPSVDVWEAILEPNFGNHNPLNLTKDQYYQAIATSIKAIRENDPSAQIEINLSYPCGGIDWLDNFQFVREMLDRNIDFDVIGLQFYYNAYIQAGNYAMPRKSFTELSSCYDKYSEMLAPSGKKIVGSEFSVPSEAPSGQMGYWGTPWSEETQAQYLTTAYTIFFSKPTNLGLIWWNTVEPSPFVYHGGLVREDGTPKKSYFALQRLIENWTTTGEGTTDSSGAVSFRGFGGDYKLEIVDPTTGKSMGAQVHVTEQKSVEQTVKFVPNNLLSEKKAALEKLIAYWESKSEQDLAQKGKDYLALVDHHVENSEWALAGQTLTAALDQLAITTELVIPNGKFITVTSNDQGKTIIENGSALIWGATTLHFPYDFPAGIVTVEIKAHAQNEKGESPIMVSGVGANYSQLWKVENTESQTYSFTVSMTGTEENFTIRFPYDGRIYERITAQNGEAGELKLYIDQAKLIIKTTEVP